MDELTAEQKKVLIQVLLGLSFIVTVITGIINHSFTIQELALFTGALIGIGLKVLIPFIRKICEGKLENFGVEYLWMMIGTFLYNIPIVFVLLNQLDWTGIGTGWALIIAGLLGLGCQWLTEELYRIAKNRKGQFTILGTTLALIAGLAKQDEESPEHEPLPDEPVEPEFEIPNDGTVHIVPEPDPTIEESIKEVVDDLNSDEPNDPTTIPNILSEEQEDNEPEFPKYG